MNRRVRAVIGAAKALRSSALLETGDIETVAIPRENMLELEAALDELEDKAELDIPAREEFPWMPWIPRGRGINGS